MYAAIITPIELNNQRVLSTRQLAEAYGTTPDVISKNFNRNQIRYKKGKHYCLLEGEELKEFKMTSGQIDDSLLRVNKLYFWTERGALLHAKSLNTDQAWDVYEQLLEHYFRTTDNSITNVKNASRPSFGEVAAALPVLADFLRVNAQSRQQMAENLCQQYGVSPALIPFYSMENKNREQASATELLIEFGAGISAIEFNKRMVQAGMMERRTRSSSTGNSKSFNSLVDEGLNYGVNVINPKCQKETQPLYFRDTFRNLLNKI